MGMYCLPPEQIPGSPVVPWEPDSSPEPCYCRKEGVVDECCVLMENKALLVQKVGSEDVFSDKRNFGFDSHVFPQALGGLEVRRVAGVGSAHVFLRNLLLYLPGEPSVWQKHSS